MREYASDEQIIVSPMVRGRIKLIDGVPVNQVTVSDDVEWATRNDRGIGYSGVAPKNVNIVQGKWWPEDYQGKPLMSVDERFLKGMGLDIGDTMTLTILGQDITATIANARKIDYSTFQINFAIMLSPNIIDSFPHTSVATIHLDSSTEKELALLQQIGKDFPGVTVIRTKEIVELIHNIMKHIATALRITVSISLIAGLLVLISALSATIEQRMYDTAMLKVIGAKKSDILKCCTAEWMLIALATSLIAAFIGTLSAWLINDQLRGQSFLFMPEITLLNIILCSTVIWIVGYLGNQRLFNLRPSSLLRNE
jgi:putative ABC transport system permease protein